MESWNIALLILGSVLVGALLPLLVQLRATLRSAQSLLDESRPRVAKTLDELLLATRDVRGLVADANAARPQAAAFLEIIAGLTETLNQVQASVRTASVVGAAVAPAIAAAIQAFRTIRAEDAQNQRLAPDGASEAAADLRS